MLVFSPATLPKILDSLIANYRPRFKDATPANTLYMLARFAALTCDHNWLEDLLIGATDAIEETFFVSFMPLPEIHILDLTQPSESCRRPVLLGVLALQYDALASSTGMRQLDQRNLRDARFVRIDRGGYKLCIWCVERSSSKFYLIFCFLVFIIRFAERRIDQLLDATILSYSPSPAEFEAVQFESEWSFLRSFAGKRKAPPASPKKPTPTSPTNSYRPLSPSQSQASLSSSTSRGFSSLRETLSRARGQSSAPPLSSIFQDPAPAPAPSPLDLTSFLTSLHMLLVLSDINPAIITQLWSQVMYWTSCVFLFYGQFFLTITTFR